MSSSADVRPDPYPAPRKQATGPVNGSPAEASCTNFSDKIMITISQGGRLSQWIQVPLSAPSPALLDMSLPAPGTGTLPSTHLTAQTLLGAGGDARETLGQLYAAQIGSHLSLRDPEDRRTLLLGLGLEQVAESREAFFDVLELVQKVL